VFLRSRDFEHLAFEILEFLPDFWKHLRVTPLLTGPWAGEVGAERRGTGRPGFRPV